MSGWAEVRPENSGGGLGPGEVPEGTPGAVPIRFDVDLLGRRVPVAWTVPAAGARDYWDARRTGPNLIEQPFE
ncbi:hypothetical protein [Pseudactinotalea sp.]|uniref:hypothetical protein n=1 Tax=Pseudactinotalea sp. TaxID=1926260 RepID=UPI003B3A3A55